MKECHKCKKQSDKVTQYFDGLKTVVICKDCKQKVYGGVDRL